MSGIISSPQFNGEFPETASAGADDVHAGTIRGTVTGKFCTIEFRSSTLLINSFFASLQLFTKPELSVVPSCRSSLETVWVDSR